MASLIIIGAISGMMLMWTFEGPIEQTLSMREWQPLETGAPAAGESGVVGVILFIQDKQHQQQHTRRIVLLVLHMLTEQKLVTSGANALLACTI